ncbi:MULTISPECIES: structural protein P5 [Bombella]|uniref:Structural protein P5 n=1 Tax=Bombella pollinis TaxID=2967337 RepID=A0ABT3WIM9_9PROT|nr:MULTISPECIES: structural protein P5 [Bombella]MCX5618826.1 structural protein P5 [Bombella pollinis]MUG04152.1 structural protein P5 [Bombella sp. ESL0378]
MGQTDSRPRGIRNNNPGNLNFAHQPGAVLEPGPNARFARFPTPEAGLEALRDQLARYILRDHIDTVTGIISKWAPPTENDTSSYIEGVSHSLGVEPDETLGQPTPRLLSGLMNAIIRFENGQNPYGGLVLQVASDMQKDVMT